MPREARPQYLALDLLLAAEELAGFALSNRPQRRRRPGTQVVLVADRFPERRDPLAELAGSLEGARVEAAARPDAPDLPLYRRLAVDYREDDGTAARILSSIALVANHPMRCTFDLLRRRGGPPLRELAPAVRRLERDDGARVQALGGTDTQAIARRLARLAGRW